MNRCLSLAPAFEIVTSRIHSYMIPLLKETELHGTDVFLLEKSEVTRENLEKFSKDKNFLFLMGHGLENLLTGNAKDSIILDDKNIELTKNKTVYAFSCLTAETLGRRAISAGADAYCGYIKEFQLWTDSKKHPLADNLARGCITPALEFVRSLYNGKTTGEALADTKKAFEEMIELWETVDSPTSSFVVASLQHNLSAMVLLGSENSRISNPFISLRTILSSIFFS